MPSQRSSGALAGRVSGHLQVKGPPRARKYFASWVDIDGAKHFKTLGKAHVRDSGKRTSRGAVIWRAGEGACPPGALTPQAAEARLAEILEDARTPRLPLPPVDVEPIPTFGDAVELWLEYLRVEKQRKKSTLRDAKNAAHAYLLPRFGADTPLYTVERYELVVEEHGRRVRRFVDERRDTFTTEDVDEFRRELLASHLSVRSAQKILVLLHGVFRLAVRRKLIQANPSADAERVTVVDPGTFTILEPAEFECVYRAVLGQLDERSDADREDDDAIDDLSEEQRQTFACALALMFYAGPRMGETRDLQWRCVDFARSVLRVESNFVQGERSTPKGKRSRSAPLVPILAHRLAALSTSGQFTAPADYVFSTALGDRITDRLLRSVFYAALVRAGLGHKREETDRHGNPQDPMTPHDLRHSYCTWAVNVWPITKVKEFAGHADVKTTMRYVHHQTKEDDAELGGAYLTRTLGADEPVPNSP
jgi:integrase